MHSLGYLMNVYQLYHCDISQALEYLFRYQELVDAKGLLGFLRKGLKYRNLGFVLMLFVVL